MKKKENEMELKRWIAEESDRLNLRPGALIMRILRGKHPRPKIRCVNDRVKFVQL